MSSLFDKSAPTELCDGPLTTSYVGSAVLDVSTHSHVTLTMFYSPDDGTGLEVLPEVLIAGSAGESDDEWQPAVSTLSAGTPASGAVAMEMLATSYTLPAAGSRSLEVKVLGATSFRVRVRELGAPGTPGEATVYAVRSRLGA
ncbi:MAG: hypothetical protein Q8S73_37860 [Deltaproteobacteria bacterium]|nr:hypothetical protein [Myxococcales bacterium]MDP3219928.1 hypothetical protein [Deltaproteobacteria bacterium]